MRYRMSVIYGHPVIAATRALRFADQVSKRNGGSGDENIPDPTAVLFQRMTVKKSEESWVQNVPEGLAQ